MKQEPTKVFNRGNPLHLWRGGCQSITKDPNMLEILQGLLHWSMPRACLLCNFASEDPHLNICNFCMQHLPWFKEGCYKCGVKLASNDLTTICINCSENPPPFDRVYALFRYLTPINGLINNLKFAQQLYPALLFAKLLSKQIKYKWYLQQNLPEVIIPVPLHLKRYQQRGYNQVLEICRPLGKLLKTPVNTSSTHRRIHTLAQSKLKLDQRLINVKNAFVANILPYKHVALVDDVVTTGSTVRAMSLALHAAGIEQIDIWCVCRG